MTRPAVPCFRFLCGFSANSGRRVTAGPAKRPTGASARRVPPAAQTPDAPPAATKKVWTNDDLSGLHNQPAISTGVSNSVRAQIGEEVRRTRNEAPRGIGSRLLKLQAKLPPLDEQIAELQAAIDGKPTGDARKSVRPYSVRLDNWTAELDQLARNAPTSPTKLPSFETKRATTEYPRTRFPELFHGAVEISPYEVSRLRFHLAAAASCSFSMGAPTRFPHSVHEPS